MLKELELRHFKCFSHLKLPVSGLTLLSGRNSSGKSSILHALALLHQTFSEHEHSTRLLLNGATVDLGTVSDVINEEHGRRTIGISLSDTVGEFEWEFEGDRLEMSMEVLREASSLGRDIATASDKLRYLLPLSHNALLNDDSVQTRLRPTRKARGHPAPAPKKHPRKGSFLHADPGVIIGCLLTAGSANNPAARKRYVKLAHVRRQIGLELHPLPCPGVDHAQRRRMKRLPWKTFRRGTRVRIQSGRKQPRSAAIKRVADQRMSDTLQMDTNLMGSACLQATLDQGRMSFGQRRYDADSR